MATEEEVRALQTVIMDLRNIASSDEATDIEMQQFLGASFSFENGNAHRPDIPTNATLSEFCAWKSQYQAYLQRHKNQTNIGGIPEFRVRKYIVFGRPRTVQNLSHICFESGILI